MASSVRILAPHVPVVRIAIAAGLPFTAARRVRDARETFRATYALELAIAQVDEARARLELLRRAAVLSQRWRDLREIEGAQKHLERSLAAHYRAQALTPAANDTPTTPGPAPALAA